MAKQPKVSLLFSSQFLVFVLLLHLKILFFSLLKLNPIGFDWLNFIWDSFYTANLSIIWVFLILTDSVRILRIIWPLVPTLKLNSLSALKNWFMEISLSSKNDFIAIKTNFIFSNFSFSFSLAIFNNLKDPELFLSDHLTELNFGVHFYQLRVLIQPSRSKNIQFLDLFWFKLNFI